MSRTNCAICGKGLGGTTGSLCPDCQMKLEARSSRKTGKPPAYMEREELAGLSQIEEVLKKDSARMEQQATRRKASQARTEESKDE